jgi:hypothetical protein
MAAFSSMTSGKPFSPRAGVLGIAVRPFCFTLPAAVLGAGDLRRKRPSKNFVQFRHAKYFGRKVSPIFAVVGPVVVISGQGRDGDPAVSVTAPTPGRVARKPRSPIHTNGEEARYSSQMESQQPEQKISRLLIKNGELPERR